MAPAVPNQPLQDETDLPDEDAASIVDFLDAPKDHGRDDVLEYRRRQRSAAELALADMIADTERLGLYDTDPKDFKAALEAARKKHEG